MSFGDGSDGDVTISSDTALTADMNYNNLTINAGVTLDPDGYIIYVKNNLILNGTIQRDGNPGLDCECRQDGIDDWWWYYCYNNGGGPALPTRSLGGSGAGGIGGGGGGDGPPNQYYCDPGVAGSNVEGIANSSGGRGENSRGLSPCNGAAGGTTTTAHIVDCQNIDDIITNASTRLGGPGGGGGGGSPSGEGGAGGGGGSGGGVIYISAKIISGSGAISAIGGNGYACQFAIGGGGGGGAIIIEYSSKSGFVGTTIVDGGAGANPGTIGTIIFCPIALVPSGKISCESTPSGASILLGKVVEGQPILHVNQQKTTDPFGVVVLSDIEPGDYSIMYTKDGYTSCTVPVTVYWGGVAYAHCTLSPIATTGALECITNPAGAEVYLDGSATSSGTTPLILSDLLPGTHTVIFKLAGYEDCTIQQDVEVSKTRSAMCGMVMPSEDGFILCQAYDSVTNAGLSATIQIDGLTIVPLTPHTTRGLPPGEHTITFILEGYETAHDTVDVITGETVNAYGSMVKTEEIPGTGFDINVNIPGLLPATTLYVTQVVKVPFTNTYWRHPIGHGMRWDNITNFTYRARELSANSKPTPDFHVGFAENEDYAIYAGTSAIAFYPGTIVHRSTSGMTEIDLTSSYVDWVSSKVCAALDITPANCPFFIASSVSDAAFFLELWSIITKHENLAGEHTLPTALDYALFPIAIFGMLSPGISEGKIVQIVGKRITELIPLSRKGTPEIKAVMQDPGLDTFLLRATDSQFNDFVKWIEAGADGTARNLLKTVDEAPLSKNDLHALQRASKFVEALDPKLTKAGSIENLKTVLKNFSGKFKNIFRNALDFARDNPKTTVGVGILAIWFMIDNVPFYIYMYLKSKGLAPGDRSYQGTTYIDAIDQYKFNVIEAQKIADWTIFCTNLNLWIKEVDRFEAFVNDNTATLQNEGTYDIYVSTIAVYREAISIKQEVHTCIEEALPVVITAKVIDVIDGDSVVIEYEGKEYQCRLTGINTPEGPGESYLVRRLACPTCTEERWNANKALYDQVKVWANTNMWHKDLVFKSDLNRQFDGYGRLLAVPFDGTINLCKKELELGLAVVYFYDDNIQVNTSEFLAAEKVAKDTGTGVWAIAIDTGTIKCTSIPTAAEVWLDGEFTGKKTISNVAYLENVSVGSHKVTFKKIIDDVAESCSDTVTVIKDETVTAECTLVEIEVPPEPEKAAIWDIKDVRNAEGTVLSAAKVHVDGVYIKHYAPEKITFCADCICDDVVPCGFGSHTVTIKKTGYIDWVKTRTLNAGDIFIDNPIMVTEVEVPEPTFPVEIESLPSGAIIKVDGIVI